MRKPTTQEIQRQLEGTYAPPVQPRGKQSAEPVVYGNTCHIKCAGGNKCVGNSRDHVYHICKLPGCECRDKLRKGLTS